MAPKIKRPKGPIWCLLADRDYIFANSYMYVDRKSQLVFVYFEPSRMFLGRAPYGFEEVHAKMPRMRAHHEREELARGHFPQNCFHCGQAASLHACKGVDMYACKI